MRDDSMIASDPEISAWVAANAGAGKTYTLANRVARLLLGDARPEKILCLTFTKAAAAEMQGRLFAQLGRWSMLPDEDLRAAIESIGAQSGDLICADDFGTLEPCIHDFGDAGNLDAQTLDGGDGTGRRMTRCCRELGA